MENQNEHTCPFCKEPYFYPVKQSSKFIYWQCGRCGCKRKKPLAKSEIKMPEIKEEKKDVERVMVQTPAGEKYHGYIEQGMFCRNVSDKDMMRIFQAWSIHPEALENIKQRGINGLCYYHKDAKTKYSIPLSEALKLGFEREFAGGKTFYIQLKHWKTEPIA